jgi:hypothetical protein
MLGVRVTCHALFGELFLFQRNTARGYGKVFLYFEFTAFAAAPHCLYETGLRVGYVDKLIVVMRDISARIHAFGRALQQVVLYIVEKLLNGGGNPVQRDGLLF